MGRNSVHKIKRPPRYSQPASVVHLEDEYDLFELIKQTSNPTNSSSRRRARSPQSWCMPRTASGAGVTAVIAPVKGSCSITHTVRDVSCGGADDTPFLKVKNINSLLRKFQAADIQLVGTSDRGKGSLYEVDLNQPTAFLLGSEGWGIRKVTGDLCDHLVTIPMNGRVDCLNVSVSAGVCLYEAVRQRL